MITESAFAQNLALLPLTLSELVEQGAYWLLLLFALFCGFLLAWTLQAMRRRRMVQQLWAIHQRKSREQYEEARLLAEDLASEQASQLAYQARRIAQLKTMLMQQSADIARRVEHSAMVASAPRLVPGTSSVSPRSTPPHASAPMSRDPRATAAFQPTTTARQRNVQMSVSVGDGNASRTSAPMSESRPVPAPTQALVPPRHTAPRSYTSLRPPTIMRRDHGMGEAALLVLKRRLALELRINREKARLLRHYEAEAMRWQRAQQASDRQCQTLHAAVTALENALQETRQTWAEAEREVERLRKRLQVRPPQRADVRSGGERTSYESPEHDRDDDLLYGRDSHHYPMLTMARRLLSSRGTDGRASRIRSL
ncbi:MAG: hypothetical protein Q4A16_07165 [Lautropia sp.]|nr:hypothetical protein [Lautropia sp.]